MTTLTDCSKSRAYDDDNNNKSVSDHMVKALIIHLKVYLQNRCVCIYDS
jgi:hypothetical protein